MDNVKKFGYKLGGTISNQQFLDGCNVGGGQLSLALLVRNYSSDIQHQLGNQGRQNSENVVYTGPIDVSRIYELLPIDDVLAVTLIGETKHFTPPIGIQLCTERYDADELLKG
jgi:hypothetical protein